MICWHNPIHIRYFVDWSQMRIRISMTIQAPAHRERFYLHHTTLIHLRDIAVAALASDTDIDMHTVLKYA